MARDFLASSANAESWAATGCNKHQQHSETSENNLATSFKPSPPQKCTPCSPCYALPKCPSETLKVADCVAALASLPLRCASDLLTPAAQDQTVSTSSVSHCHTQTPKRHTHEACEFPVRAKSLWGVAKPDQVWSFQLPHIDLWFGMWNSSQERSIKRFRNNWRTVSKAFSTTETAVCLHKLLRLLPQQPGPLKLANVAA